MEPADGSPVGPRRRFGIVCGLLVLLLSGCSARQAAVRTLASSLAGSADVFASDDDPELVAQALPFALKSFEALLASDPDNADLLLATCRGFTQYAYAFVELEAERLKLDDFRASRRPRERALGLYLRARDYCLRALDLRRPGASGELLRQPEAAVADFDADDVPLLYWTAGSWGSAISAGRHRPEIVVDLPAVRALLRRCLQLDPAYDHGAVHDAMVVLESLPATMGGSYDRARGHFDRAVELNGGARVGSYLNWAWLVAQPRQDRRDFESTLRRALDVDLEARPQDRLANTVNRDFARFLLQRADEMFLDEVGEADDDTQDAEPNHPGGSPP